MGEPAFFPLKRPISVGEIAGLTGALMMDSSQSDAMIHRLAAASEGGDGTLVFIEGRRGAGLAGSVHATAVLCADEIATTIPKGVAVLVTKTPQRAFAAVGRHVYAEGTRPGSLTGETGVSRQAHIASDAMIEDGAVIEPGAVIGRRAAIGRGAIIAPGAVIGHDCRIGRDTFIGPCASVVAALIGDRVIIHAGARIGQDGFGFVAGARGLEKMPQIGRVIIQDDVEIGANTTVDRGALSDTIIGEGTKIDNLVQIAHNVKIGRSCAIAAKCGLSGSVELGDFVMLGGNVGVADHVKIGTGAQLAAGSGVMNDVPAAARWAGAPAQSMRDFFREVSTIRAMAKAKSTRRSGDE